jgi:hypothetical protein
MISAAASLAISITAVRVSVYPHKNLRCSFPEVVELLQQLWRLMLGLGNAAPCLAVCCILSCACLQTALAFTAPHTVRSQSHFVRSSSSRGQRLAAQRFHDAAVKMAAGGGVEALKPAAASGVNGFPAGLSLGAPRHRPDQTSYTTGGGVEVTCEVGPVSDASSRVEALITALDEHKGVLLSSSYEFPGRYARWTVGFVDPPIEVAGTGSSFTVRALNERGRALLPAFWTALSEQTGAGGSVGELSRDESEGLIEGTVAAADGKDFAEEDRSRQPSLFSVVRSIVQLFSYEGDPQLGLYGAFGYDLTFQFEPIEKVRSLADCFCIWCS